MTFILDSIRQINGDMARCSSCLSYVDLLKAERCPQCKSVICYHCGHCHCELSEARKIVIWAKQDDWPGNTEFIYGHD